MSNFTVESSGQRAIDELRQLDPCLPWCEQTKEIEQKIAQIQARMQQAHPRPSLPTTAPLLIPPQTSQSLPASPASDDAIMHDLEEPVAVQQGNSPCALADHQY